MVIKPSQLTCEEAKNKVIRTQIIKIIIIVAVNVLCLIAFFICLSASDSLRTMLRSQQAADAWSGQSGERFSQLSAFFPESSDFSEESIYNIHLELDRALLTASLESTPNRNLFTDAWSAVAEVTVTSEFESNPVTVNAIAVGGDFFLFHPLYLRDGSYLTREDLMKDRVLIDEALAWRLFGATRLTGFEVRLEGKVNDKAFDKVFKIAGVISRDSDFASQRAFTDEFGLFMDFDALMTITEGEAEISSYELVMPDPISGFAYNSFSDAISDPRVHIVENSTRFSLESSFSLLGSFGQHSMRTDNIVLPYWENAARIVEDWLALLLVLSIMLIIFPTISAVVYTVKAIRFGVRQGMNAIRNLIDERDKRAYDKYMKEHGNEPQIYDEKDVYYNIYEGDQIIDYDIYGGEEIIDYDLLKGEESIEHDRYKVEESIDRYPYKSEEGIVYDLYTGKESTDRYPYKSKEGIDYDFYTGEKSVNYDIYKGEEIIDYDIFKGFDSLTYPGNADDNIIDKAIVESISNDVSDIMGYGSGYDKDDPPPFT